jgi:hypothetical protein
MKEFKGNIVNAWHAHVPVVSLQKLDLTLKSSNLHGPVSLHRTNRQVSVRPTGHGRNQIMYNVLHVLRMFRNGMTLRITLYIHMFTTNTTTCRGTCDKPVLQNQLQLAVALRKNISHSVQVFSPCYCTKKKC